VDREIRWSPKAADSLEEICDYIARDSEHYAALFAKRILATIDRIPAFPKLGRVVPEYEDENLREVLFHNYRVVYRLRKEAIEVVLITHGARQLRLD